MWKRKELKNNAKEVVHKNYWTAIVVCFLIALLTGDFGNSIVGIWQADDTVDPNYIINNESIINNNDMAKDIAEDANSIFNMKEIRETLSKTQTQVFEAVEANLNSVTKSQKYLFRIWDAISSFHIRETGLGVGLCIIAVFALAFCIFVAEPLTVGGKRYFIKARQGSNTKIGVMWEVFKNKNFINISIVMLFKNIYNLLWYLTIIGGFIKSYEYRMIPYILAEKPKIKRKEAFELSKQMMKGNKWKTFILDMSFFLWNLLSTLTFGIVGMLYVNPYNAATIMELYMALREKAIKESYRYCENFNEDYII